nr:hypothetical protein [Tanacetum cinerariifolium]
MALVLMAKAFKLNNLTPTNNNQRISSNPRNRKIAQPGMNMGQDRQMQMVKVLNVRNQVVQNAVQNPAHAEGNAIGNNADLDEIKKVNANSILMANLQQSSTSGASKILEPIPEPHQVQQNDSIVISAVSSVEQGRRTIEQHSATI